MNSAQLKKFMYSIAHGAGRVLLKYLDKVHQIERKHNAGIVTEADKFAEAYLLKNIFRKFPNSSIITEESGEYKRSDSLCWVLDPLDGTSNYAHGFPWFCVSIGLYEDGKPRAGVIYQPVTKELFFAEAGRGAYLNDKRIRVSAERRMEECFAGHWILLHPGQSAPRGDGDLQPNERSRPGRAAAWFGRDGSGVRCVRAI